MHFRLKKIILAALFLSGLTPFAHSDEAIPVTPICAEDTWTCTDWEVCFMAGQQNRTCTMTDDCLGIETLSPVTFQECTPPCTEDTWTCSDWNFCPAEGVQTRACNKTFDCTLTETSSPPLTQSCTQPFPENPEILSVSPSELIPGKTTAYIRGRGFGDTYDAQKNQICFEQNCIDPGSMSEYLDYWSDKEIAVKIPLFVMPEVKKINIGAYRPRDNIFGFVGSPDVVIKPRLLVAKYYQTMDQGGIYTLEGEFFGTEQGRVTLEDSTCEIKSWSNTSITFKVPDNTRAGTAALVVSSMTEMSSEKLKITVVAAKHSSSDPLSKDQWFLEPLHIPEAWKITEGSKDVVVAVIDTGVYIYHEDLLDSIWENKKKIPNNEIDDDHNGYVDDIYGWDFAWNSASISVKSSHGTMIASIIAAQKDNGIGLAGIAPKVKIMPLNVATPDGNSISVDASIEAIKYAVDNGANIINLSFGGYKNDKGYRDAIQYAYDNNILVVAAVGNEGKNLDEDPIAPACTDGLNNQVLGVAALDSNLRKVSNSNYGKKCVDLSAPGKNIPVAAYSDYTSYGKAGQTSFATGVVTGVAALLKSAHPDWNVEELKVVLLDTAQNLSDSNPKFSDQLGKGMPDALSALRAPRATVSYVFSPRRDLIIQKKNITTTFVEPALNPILKEKPSENRLLMKDKIQKKDLVPKSSSPQSSGTTNQSLRDISQNPYKESIQFLQEKKIVQGYSDNTFRPNQEINRAEFIKIVMNGFEKVASGQNCFPDVHKEWFAPFVCSAKSLGVTNGLSNGLFAPNQPISTAEALKILIRLKGVRLFANASPSEAWYTPYVRHAQGKSIGFILKKNRPEKNITRAQMAELLVRALKN